MARLPRALTIGPYRYELRVDAPAVLTYTNIVGTGANGFSELLEHRIVLASAENAHHVILHEILHVLADQSGLDMRLGTDRTEDVIQSIDHLLLGVIRANPALVEYLTET